MTDIEPPSAGEKPLILLSEHWMKYSMPLLLILSSWALFVICEIVSAALMQWGHATSVAALIIGHLLLLIFHHAAFYQLFSISTGRTLVTNRRIFGSMGRLWLSEDVTDIPLWKIRSLEVSKQGIVQQILDYGSIRLNRGELPGLQLVPHPNAVHARIVSQLQKS